jgi:hypothetical protein
MFLHEDEQWDLFPRPAHEVVIDRLAAQALVESRERAEKHRRAIDEMCAAFIAFNRRSEAQRRRFERYRKLIALRRENAMNAPVPFHQELVPFNDMQKMADAIAKSGLFGMKEPAQALALMLTAQAEGQHPATITQDYDIIQGKATRKTHSVLARFQQSGGHIEWHVLTESKADATFTPPSGAGKPLRMEWTIDMAKRAGLVEKDNWRRYPRAMLRARCIAEGVRATYPAAIGGFLVPEEAQDLDFVAGEVIERSVERSVEPPSSKSEASPATGGAANPQPSQTEAGAAGGASASNGKPPEDEKPLTEGAKSDAAQRPEARRQDGAGSRDRGLREGRRDEVLEVQRCDGLGEKAGADLMLTFDEASHTYFWAGRRVPNVTRVIAHLTDYSKIDPDRLRIAQDEGKAVHKMVELDCRASSTSPRCTPTTGRHGCAGATRPGSASWTRPASIASWPKRRCSISSSASPARRI